MVEPKLTIPAPLVSANDAKLSDSKSANSSAQCAAAGEDFKSSRLLRALLSLDEKYGDIRPPTLAIKSVSTDTVKSSTDVALAKSNASFSIMRSALGKGQRGVVVKLVSSGSTTGSANTAFFPVIAIVPSGFTDFAGFAALYDEYRIRRAILHFNVGPSAPPTTVGSAIAVAFDPVNSGAYVSISDAITAQHSKGPCQINTANAVPLARNETGYWTLGSGKLVPTVLPNGSSVLGLSVGGAWIGTADTQAVVGYWKGAINALGASVSATLAYTIVLEAEFRMRT